MPRPAILCLDNAPVHIDVGGILYTSSLETLTKHSDSLISKMFNGSVPIVLDSLKQHYFIDRDGKLFRHVLNFMRTGHVSLPSNFDDYEGLFGEARFYELTEMVARLEAIAEARRKSTSEQLLQQSQPGGSARKFSKTLRFSPYSYSSSCGSSSSKLDQGHVSSSTMVSRSVTAAGILLNKNLPSSSTGSSGEENVEEMPPAEDEIPASDTNTGGSSIAEVITSQVSTDETDLQTSSSETPSQPPPVGLNPQSSSSKVKILIVNQVENRLYVSGESQIIRNVLPELSLANSSEASPADVASTYLSKLSLNEQAELSEMHLVKLMERIYEQEFTLEACYTMPPPPSQAGETPAQSSALQHHSEASTQYIFVNKQ
jgi:hypothetical protein